MANDKKGSNKSQKKGSNKRILFLAIVIIGIALIVLIVNLNSKNSEESTLANGTTSSEDSEANSYVEEIEDGVKINKNSQLNSAKTVDGLTVSNVQLTLESGMTTLLADVTNNTSEATGEKQINITLLEKDGTELVTVPGIIKSLEVGETTELIVAMSSDYINAYDFSITVQ